MKKFIALISALAVTLAACAADYTAIVQQVLKKNATRSYTCTFDQVKYIKMMKKEVKSAGTLYTCKGNMTMRYSEPAGDFLVINDKQFVMQTRGKKMDHNIQKGSPLLTLRNTLLYCMHGDIESIAKENNGVIGYTKEGKLHVFSITTQSKIQRGYSKIVLKYNEGSLDLCEMTMEEVVGNYTIYTLGTIKDGPIDAATFTVR